MASTSTINDGLLSQVLQQIFNELETLHASLCDFQVKASKCRENMHEAHERQTQADIKLHYSRLLMHAYTSLEDVRRNLQQSRPTQVSSNTIATLFRSAYTPIVEIISYLKRCDIEPSALFKVNTDLESDFTQCAQELHRLSLTACNMWVGNQDNVDSAFATITAHIRSNFCKPTAANPEKSNSLQETVAEAHNHIQQIRAIIRAYGSLAISTNGLLPSYITLWTTFTAKLQQSFLQATRQIDNVAKSVVSADLLPLYTRQLSALFQRMWCTYKFLWSDIMTDEGSMPHFDNIDKYLLVPHGDSIDASYIYEFIDHDQHDKLSNWAIEMADNILSKILDRLLKNSDLYMIVSLCSTLTSFFGAIESPAHLVLRRPLSTHQMAKERLKFFRKLKIMTSIMQQISKLLKPNQLTEWKKFWDTHVWKANNEETDELSQWIQLIEGLALVFVGVTDEALLELLIGFLMASVETAPAVALQSIRKLILERIQQNADIQPFTPKYPNFIRAYALRVLSEVDPSVLESLLQRIDALLSVNTPSSVKDQTQTLI